jgi:glycosyltransferase involved in cell wall biosynthesis
MNPSDEITICFKVCPGRHMEIYNAMSSMLEIQPYAKNVLIIFNPYDPSDHDSLLDIREIRHADIIKLSKFESLAKAWNQCMLFSNTRYCLILDDDIVFKDEKVLEKVYKKHQEGFPIVHVTENWSGFSIDKAKIPQMGWFDERFSYAWEDADYRLRMKRLGIDRYQFSPHLVRHTRSSGGRCDIKWNKSSGHFFKKWGIQDLLKKGGIDLDTSDPEVRRGLLMGGFFNDQFYDTVFDKVNEVDPTPDFYPVSTEKYMNGDYSN